MFVLHLVSCRLVPSCRGSFGGTLELVCNHLLSFLPVSVWKLELEGREEAAAASRFRKPSPSGSGRSLARSVLQVGVELGSRASLGGLDRAPVPSRLALPQVSAERGSQVGRSRSVGEVGDRSPPGQLGGALCSTHLSRWRARALPDRSARRGLPTYVSLSGRSGGGDRVGQWLDSQLPFSITATCASQTSPPLVD